MNILSEIVVGLLMTFPTMWLWNWLMPIIFGLFEVTFWQAALIYFFLRLIIVGIKL